MRILVLQHATGEHAGRFRQMFRDANLNVTEIVVPEANGEWLTMTSFDALWVLGGVMQVWETDLYPWLKDEMDFIRHAVIDHGKPYFGICLGHQLLAQALGGNVGLANDEEFGLISMRPTDQAASGFRSGMPFEFPAFSWHAAEVKALPEGFEAHLKSDECAFQHMTGPKAVTSVQFHAEVDTDTLQDWFTSPDVPLALEEKLGAGGEARMLEMIREADAELDTLARSLFDEWLEAASSQIISRQSH